MAFTAIIRSSTLRVLPLAARILTGQRFSHTLISAVGRTNLSGNSISGSFSSICRYSALATKNTDDSLLRIIDTEIKCAEESEEIGQAGETVDIPDNFPFKIEDHPGLQTISLSREYEGETINVEVSMPDLVTGEDDDDDNDDNDNEKGNQSCIPLVVRVAKKGQPSLEFGCTAYPDEVVIDSLSVKEENSNADEIAYDGPDFSDLDENLQKAFHKYLEIRGIKPSATNFLHEYMINKDGKEYTNWLYNLKKFVEA